MTLSMELHDPAELGMSVSRLADAAALMDRQFADGLTPTAVALVARHGQLVWTHAVGNARPGGPPVTIDSVFPLASQTKPMTAAVIMALAERGMIGLTESASLTLPELAGEHEEVMVYHLLAAHVGLERRRPRRRSRGEARRGDRHDPRGNGRVDTHHAVAGMGRAPAPSGR